jgi:hypothetical protein
LVKIHNNSHIRRTRLSLYYQRHAGTNSFIFLDSWRIVRIPNPLYADYELTTLSVYIIIYLQSGIEVILPADRPAISPKLNAVNNPLPDK